MIGHSEHFNDDIKVLAKSLNIDPSFLPDSYDTVNEHSLAHNTEFLVRKTTEEMFQNISRNTIRALRNIYQADYDLFGYKMPHWLANA